MKRTIKLTEKQLSTLIKKVITEQETKDSFNVDVLYDDIVRNDYHEKIIGVISNFILNKEGKTYTKDQYYRDMITTINKVLSEMLNKYGKNDSSIKLKIYEYMDEFIKNMYIEAGERIRGQF